MTERSTRKVIRKMYPNGALESEYTEVDGQVDGYRRHWYPTGQLLAEAEYANGVANGPIREWAENGILILSATRKTLDGRYESWWNDGKPKEQGEFKDGVRQSGYCWFRSDGTLWQSL